MTLLAMSHCYDISPMTSLVMGHYYDSSPITYGWNRRKAWKPNRDKNTNVTNEHLIATKYEGIWVNRSQQVVKSKFVKCKNFFTHKHNQEHKKREGEKNCDGRDALLDLLVPLGVWSWKLPKKRITYYNTVRVFNNSKVDSFNFNIIATSLSIWNS